VGPFAVKCPYKRGSNHKKTKDYYIIDKDEYKRKIYNNKKKLYANDEGKSSNEEDNNTKYVLFMAINELSNDETSKHEDPNEE
jgi:hypothetical protein